MNDDNSKSAQVCGCDEGAEYVCHTHRTLNAARDHAANRRHSETLNSLAARMDVGVTELLAYAQEVGPGSIMPAKEVRVVDPKTGGEKGSKLARFSLLPMDVLWMLAEHYGKGARKYADRNWERGYDWSLSYDALQRHLAAFWHREEVGNDEVIGKFRHIIAVVWHAVALAAFSIRGSGNDNRPSGASIKEGEEL